MNYTYHFPIILGQDEAERVVMIHLSDLSALNNEPDEDDDLFDEDDDDLFGDDDTDFPKENAEDTQKTTVEEEDTVNRVVIVSGNPDRPLFKIPKEVSFIDRQGRLLEHDEVDFTSLHEIEKKRVRYKSEKAGLEKEIAKLENSQPLNKKQAKKLADLKEKKAALLEKKSRIDDEIRELDSAIRGKKVFRVEVNQKIIQQKENGDFYEYCVKNDRSGLFDKDVDFVLELNHDEYDMQTYKGSVRIVRPASDNQIMKINVDLGSDATQVGYYYGADALPPDNVDMMEAMKALYSDTRKYGDLTPPKDKPLFIQQEEGNSIYYKTGNITFHAYEKESVGYLDQEVTEQDTFINYLNVSAAGKNEGSNIAKSSDTWEKEKVFKKKLINLKMLYTYPKIVGHYVEEVRYLLSGVTAPKKVNDRRNLVPVMRAIYKQIINASINKIGITDCKYFSVLLLVPNIYVQQNIDALLYELNKLNDLDSEVRYDFRAISESDAAFVGLKEMPTRDVHSTALGKIVDGIKDEEKKDTFLIIDAGKGTTDYSIVYYNTGNGANNSTIPMGRHGIVGAGGAIDYVFARVFARQVYAHLSDVGITSSSVDQEEFIRRFMEMIPKLPSVDQDRMMLIVEHLKKEYKKGKTARVYDCFNGPDAKSIIEQLTNTTVNYSAIEGNSPGWIAVSEWSWTKGLKENTNKTDDNEVEWVCKAIAGAIVKDLFSNTPSSVLRNVDFIILTGRSFQFEPLKSAFGKALQPKKKREKTGLLTKIGELLSRKDDLEKAQIKIPDCDMKTVAVYFMTHNLGMNCNSDVCCLDKLSVIDDNSHGSFALSNFWEGFKLKEDPGKISYYIGSPGQAFAPVLDQNIPAGSLSGNETKLVNMTLFPVAFEHVTLQDEDESSDKEALGEARKNVVSSDESADDPSRQQRDNDLPDIESSGDESADHPSGQQDYNGLPDIDDFDVL